jgi:hypothetical protein
MHSIPSWSIDATITDIKIRALLRKVGDDKAQEAGKAQFTPLVNEHFHATTQRRHRQRKIRALLRKVGDDKAQEAGKAQFTPLVNEHFHATTQRRHRRLYAVVLAVYDLYNLILFTFVSDENRPHIAWFLGISDRTVDRDIHPAGNLAVAHRP